jgi:hypothetical protein
MKAIAISNKVQALHDGGHICQGQSQREGHITRPHKANSNRQLEDTSQRTEFSVLLGPNGPLPGPHKRIRTGRRTTQRPVGRSGTAAAVHESNVPPGNGGLQPGRQVDRNTHQGIPGPQDRDHIRAHFTGTVVGWHTIHCNNRWIQRRVRGCAGTEVPPH